MNIKEALNWLCVRGLSLDVQFETDDTCVVRVHHKLSNTVGVEAKDKDPEVAMKVAMNIWDRDPEAGRLREV